MPDYVNPEVFDWLRRLVEQKKGLHTSAVYLKHYAEGLCVQCMHIGPYEAEPATLAAMERFIADNGWENDIGAVRKHHEIYLSDPRKGDPAKLKTILRLPVRDPGR